MKKNTRAIWTAVLAVSLVIVIGLLGCLCWYLFGLYSGGKEYNDIKDSIMSNSEVDNVSTADSSDAGSGTYTPQKVTSKPNDENSLPSEIRDTVNGDINFTELWKINSDIYAWIRVPNTLIDYPVMQNDSDDSFYLSHNIYKQYAFAGSIYTESLNSKDFKDPNTVLYGHNMLNGTMFSTLHYFRDPDFFAQNEYIYIYMPDRTLTYRIFSAYEYDDRHILYSFDFSDEETYREYLDYAQDPVSSMTCNTRYLDVSVEDKIITLSTCMDDIDTSRYLVQGVLVSDEPTKR